MEQKIHSWILDYTINQDTLIQNICEYSNDKSYLLDLNKKHGTLIEKTIIDIATFHFKRLNIHNTENHYVEFSCKSTFDKLTDCDFNKYTKYTDNNLYPLLSCITYFNDVYNSPNIITNVNKESYNYKLFEEQNQIILSFPKSNLQISFDGNLYTTATTLNTQDIQDRYTISVNIWNHKPNNIDYYKPFHNNNNESFDMANTIINTNEVNIPSIYVCNDIINFKLFNDMLYNNKHNAGHIFDNIIKQYHKDNNENINTIKFVLDHSIKEKENQITLKNKYGDIIDDLKNITDNKFVVTHNRFLQRFTYTNIFTNDMCDYIVNESNNFAKNNGGWNTKRHEHYPTTDLPVENIPSIFPLIMQSLKTITNKIKTSYQIHDDMILDVVDLFIVKYNSQEQNSLEMHLDSSQISFNILLNNHNDFEGGGTYFEDGLTCKLECGDMLIHSGRIKHTGLPITKGERYLLVGFINIKIQ